MLMALIWAGGQVVRFLTHYSRLARFRVCDEQEARRFQMVDPNNLGEHVLVVVDEVYCPE